MTTRPGRTGKFSGAHVEVVQSVIGPLAVRSIAGDVQPAAEESVEQPVEAAPNEVGVGQETAGEGNRPTEDTEPATSSDPIEINLYDVLVAIARAESEADPERHKDGYWHPSSFKNCDRAMILERAGKEKNRHSDETVLLFWIGHVIHAAVQEATTRHMPGAIWHEIAVEDEEYHVRGHMDSLRLVEMPDGTFEPFFEVYEYKTVRTNAFNFKMPYDTHVLQVALYLTFRALCPGGTSATGCDRNICDGSGLLPLPKRGRIAYIGKEDGKIETYTIKNDPELRARVKAKLLSLQEQYQIWEDTGELPPKLEKKQIMLKGVPQVYKKSGKWGKAGDPKMEDDYRTYNCDYKGQGMCCADKEAK